MERMGLKEEEMCVCVCGGMRGQIEAKERTGAVLVPQMCTYMRANNMTNQRGWTDPPFFQSQLVLPHRDLFHL